MGPDKLHSCWQCPSKFATMKDLKNHIASKAHRRIKVICAWCYHTEKVFRGARELKAHLQSHHPDETRPIINQIATEGNSFWFSLLPEDYLKVIKPTTWSSSMAQTARGQVLEWLRRSQKPSRTEEEWQKGWRSAPQPTPEGSEVYEPESPEMEQLELHSLSLSSEGTRAVFSSLLGWYLVTFVRSIFTNIRAMASLTRRIPTLHTSPENEPTGEWVSTSPLKTVEVKMKVARQLGVDRRLIDTLQFQPSRPTAVQAWCAPPPQKKARFEESMADLGEDPCISLESPLLDKRVIMAKVPEEATTAADLELPEPELFLAKVPPSSPAASPSEPTTTTEDPATSTTETASTTIEMTAEKPPKTAGKQTTETTGQAAPRKLPCISFAEVLGPHWKDTSSSECLSSADTHAPVVSTACKTAMQQATPEPTVRVQPLPAAPSESDRASQLLRRGCMPLFPPARRNWEVASARLAVGGVEVVWPPRDWTRMTPDQRLMAWEFGAMRLATAINNGQMPETDRSFLLDQFNFLALPGSAAHKIEKRVLSSCKSRHYLYQTLLQVANGTAKDMTDWLCVLEAGARRRDRKLDAIFEAIASVPLRL